MVSESPLTGKNMAVFGGGRGWGAKIAQTGIKLGADIGIVELNTTTADRDRLVDEADIVFLAAPDTEIGGIITTVRNGLLGKSVLDCATSKGAFQKELIEVSRNSSVCSTHPMVRSETPPRGQNALIMPVGEIAEEATKIAEALFGALKMRLCRFDFEHHGDLAIVQLIPHLMQRVMIETMGKILTKQGLSHNDVNRVASANSQMTALAMGRVAIQRPDVSAGIIRQTLRTPLGRRIFTLAFESFAQIATLGLTGDDLEEQLSTDVELLDPDGAWREEMESATDMQVEAMGNFSLCSMILEVENDEPGLLATIAGVFASLNLNMNAIHSHAIEREDGQGVRFNIGVENNNVPWDKLGEECKKHGWKLARMKK